MKIFIGWDSNETEAYDVCVHSLRHTSTEHEVYPLKQSDLRDCGLYRRGEDPLASTEFTYTRFLVPELCGFEGWAMFVDCDFLFTADLDELWDLMDDKYAVMCVKHTDYAPADKTKMQGQVQTTYPRKNWSSMMLFNCEHEAIRGITENVVNEKSGAFLHRFEWAYDDAIGELPRTWNWLEGTYKPIAGEIPKGIHFTRGNCYFESWQDVDYVDEWKAEYKLMTGKEFVLPQK